MRILTFLDCLDSVDTILIDLVLILFPIDKPAFFWLQV